MRKRHVHDLSSYSMFSSNAGELTPLKITEMLPNDTFVGNSEAVIRMSALKRPVMHPLKVKLFHFFCPTRLVWPEWEKWITGDSDVEAPWMTLNGSNEAEVGSLADYLGVPTEPMVATVKISPMPFAAYIKIYDEYYRDQNLQTATFQPLVPGDNDANYSDWLFEAPLQRAWMHDYFTSALPFAQKGTEVQIPLTTTENVIVDYDNPEHVPGLVRKASDDSLAALGDIKTAAGPAPLASSLHDASTNPAAYDPNGTLSVDIQADATSINTLRRAFRLQEWLEKNARGGTRYVESILSHFGIKSSDARLQRPEYIGGSKQNMVISEVLATAETTAANVPVGQMAGHGISVGGGNSFNYSCEEHGFIIGIINVQPVTAYQQGIHRSFTRFNRLDYAWPSFAHIGEQEVLQKELYVGSATPDGVFGYVPRYAEFKYMCSRVAGEMRDTLNFWHLGRIFTNDPALNEGFISCYPSTRIFAITESNEDHIFAHVFNKISAVRKLPRYGIPTI